MKHCVIGGLSLSSLRSNTLDSWQRNIFGKDLERGRWISVLTVPNKKGIHFNATFYDIMMSTVAGACGVHRILGRTHVVDFAIVIVHPAMWVISCHLMSFTASWSGCVTHYTFSAMGPDWGRANPRKWGHQSGEWGIHETSFDEGPKDGTWVSTYTIWWVASIMSSIFHPKKY